MEYTVRSGALAGISDVLRSLGIDPEPLFIQTGIPIDTIDTPEDLICYQKYTNLLNLSAKTSGRTDFGVLLSKYQGFSMLGTIGFAMKQAPDIRTAILDLCSFLHVNAISAALDEKDGLAIWSVNVIMPHNLDYRQHLTVAVCVGAGLIRRFTNSHWRPELVHFEFKKPTNTRPYSHFFDCPVSYNQEMNAIIFDAKLLDQKIKAPNPQLYSILHEYLHQKSDANTTRFVNDVRKSIITNLQKDNCTLESVANALSIKHRTFQRRLQSNGYHFSQLLEQTRMDMAKRYLHLSDISLMQISDMLGYSEQATFSRLFKRNTGMSPTHWRTQMTQ